MSRSLLLPSVLTVGVLSISTAAVFIKLCADAAPVVIAAARLGIATLLLLPVARGVCGRRLFQLSRRQFAYLVLAGCFLAAHFVLWITSLKHTSVLSSVVIVTTNPIFIGIASYFLFKERPSRSLIAAIVVAAAGGGLIALSDAHASADSLRGDGLALGGALMASGYFLVGRRVRPDVHLLSYLTSVYAVAALVLLVLALAGGYSFFGCADTTYVYFVLLAIVPQLLGHGSLNWALRYVSATTVAVFILGEPVGSAALAYVWLGESVAPLQGCAGALILVGVFVAARETSAAPPPLA